jgi:hypothetical protein
MATAVAVADETVGELAQLYLGNILYAIELAALSLEGQGRRDDAAFYRGIARKLADAHGKGRGEREGTGGEGDAPAAGAPRGTF